MAAKQKYLELLKEGLIEFDKMVTHEGPADAVNKFDGKTLEHSKLVKGVVPVLERMYFNEENEDPDNMAAGEGPTDDVIPTANEKDLGTIATTKGDGNSSKDTGSATHGTDKSDESQSDTIIDRTKTVASESLFEEDEEKTDAKDDSKCDGCGKDKADCTCDKESDKSEDKKENDKEVVDESDLDFDLSLESDEDVDNVMETAEELDDLLEEDMSDDNQELGFNADDVDILGPDSEEDEADWNDSQTSDKTPAVGEVSKGDVALESDFDLNLEEDEDPAPAKEDKPEDKKDSKDDEEKSLTVPSAPASDDKLAKDLEDSKEDVKEGLVDLEALFEEDAGATEDKLPTTPVAQAPAKIQDAKGTKPNEGATPAENKQAEIATQNATPVKESRQTSEEKIVARLIREMEAFNVESDDVNTLLEDIDGDDMEE